MNLDYFKKTFVELATWFNRKPTTAVVAIFYDNLRGLSNEDWAKAVEIAIANEQFMPSAKQLYESVAGGVGCVWTDLMLASLKLNSLRYDSDYATQKVDVFANLSVRALDFINSEQIDLLPLANLDEYGQAKVEKQLRDFLSHSLPKHHQKEVEGKRRKLLIGDLSEH